jgi:hypothetical protein
MQACTMALHVPVCQWQGYRLHGPLTCMPYPRDRARKRMHALHRFWANEAVGGSKSLLSTNSLYARGGAIDSGSTVLTISSSQFRSNTALNGQTVYGGALAVGVGSKVTVHGSLFEQNAAASRSQTSGFASGGAVRVRPPTSSPNPHQCVWRLNAEAAGGACVQVYIGGFQKLPLGTFA